MEKDSFKRFNKHVKELYVSLLEIFPDEGIISAANLAFKIYKKFDKKGPCNYFYDTIICPYKKRIVERDMDFFAKGSIVFPYFEKGTARVQMLWNSLSEPDKEAFWDHFNVLVHLGEVAMSSNNT